ncbi:MAG: hypothetical protein DRJ49_05080 [Thermoprotei archaeon]|nr:MAG: hypothetical protein DRN53_03985 [Thermoprotei archaeon]RLE88379.1 MAG: hypothetical protein DRJ49_05080 [Thermoprotei archaeon]
MIIPSVRDTDIRPYIGLIVLILTVTSLYLLYGIFGYIYGFFGIDYSSFVLYNQLLFAILFTLAILVLIVKRIGTEK